MSIVTLFDKSFLQSLSLDEAVMFEDLLRCSGSSRPIRLTPAGGRLYVGLFDCFGEGRRREQSGRCRVRGSAMLVSDNSLEAG